MRKLITIIILLYAGIAQGQTTYQLNYDSIRVGKTAGTGGTSLYGKVYLKNVSLGLLSDSVLVVRNGRIFKVLKTSGTVTSVTGTSPISVATGTTTPVISIATANTSTTGALTDTDWNTFNDKIGGSGTTNYIPFFSGSGTLGNSPMRTDGASVGFGQAPSGSAGYSIEAANAIEGESLLLRSGLSVGLDAGIDGALTVSSDIINNNMQVGTEGTDSLVVHRDDDNTIRRISPTHYAPIASPTFTGIPTAPTATAGTNTTQLATTAFVTNGIANSGALYLPLAGGTLTGGLLGTTAGFNNLITSTMGNNANIFYSATATTGYQYMGMVNTTGSLVFGIEGASAALQIGAAAYSTVLTTGTSTNLSLGANQVEAIRINGTNRKITMQELGGAGDVIVGADNTGLLGEITVGSGLSLTAGTLTATGGASGTVTTAGGTAGKISKFTSASNIENSIMTESSGLITVAGDVEATTLKLTRGYQFNFNSVNRGGIYGYSTLAGSGSDYTPTYFSESGFGANFYVDGGLAKGFSLATTGDATFTNNTTAVKGFFSDGVEITGGELYYGTSTSDKKARSYTTGTTGSATLNTAIYNGATWPIITAVNGSGFTVTGDIAGTNLSGTNTGDQTTISGNAATATALQTARTINGTSFDGTANITVTAAAETLTGTAINTSVLSSALTSVGTLANLTVTNPISGSVTGSSGSTTGNAATVTTNANLTGVVTSVGNATSIASGAISNAMLANGAVANLSGTNTGDQNLAPYATLASPTFTGTVNITGDLIATGNVTSNSDRRLKTNINYLKSSNLSKIQPSTFDWKSTGKSDIGFIAQNIEKQFPEFVLTSEKGIKSVDYSRMTVPLVKGWQEHEAEIKELKREVEELKALVKNLLK